MSVIATAGESPRNRRPKKSTPVNSSESEPLNTEAQRSPYDPFTALALESPYPEPSIISYQDWRSFVAQKPMPRPDVPTPVQWAELSDAAKASSRIARGAYSAAIDPILTHSRAELRDLIIQQISVNRRSRDATRTSVVVRGLPTVGKTTFVMFIGKRCQIVCCQLHRGLYGQDERVHNSHTPFLPVAYIALPSLKPGERHSLRDMLRYFALFYGIPVRPGISEVDLKAAIIKAARDAKTSLVIIDELSNVDLRFVGARVVSNTLKELMNTIPATFLFAGINVTANDIFVGHDNANYVLENADDKDESKKKRVIRSESQMYHRLTDLEMRPFHGDLTQEGVEFIGELDSEILLVHHQPGDLKALTAYILRRTNGFVGAIMSLVRLACNQAIVNGSERLTEELLNGIPLSRAAEDHNRSKLGR